MAIIKEVNIRLLFSSCESNQEDKLNVEWQIVVLLKKVNIDFKDKIALLVTLHWIKNFEICNKYQSIFARHFGFVIKKVTKKDLISQMDAIWQHQNLLNFSLLICKKPEWFWE